MPFVVVDSDRSGERVERGSDTELFVDRVDAELVVTAPKILDERVAADHDARGAVGLRRVRSDRGEGSARNAWPRITTVVVRVAAAFDELAQAI